jgi:hypothetical protein
MRVPSAWGLVPVASEYVRASSLRASGNNMPPKLIGKFSLVKRYNLPIPEKMPIPHVSWMAAEWSEEAFLDRIRNRVAELGKSESALLAAAGVSVDLIRKVPEHGRRIDKVAEIARALDWTLAEAIGVQSTPRVNIELLRTALIVAERKVPRRIEDRLQVVCDAVALFYDILAQRQEEGQPPLDEASALVLADAMIRGMGLKPLR